MNPSLDLRRLFNPQSIAIVGASPVKSPGRYAHLRWLSRLGYAGALYPVNPRYQEVSGYKCYPGLADIPGGIDLAIIMVPSQRVVEILRQTPAGKLKFAAVITSGFSELGEVGLEKELLSVVRAKGIRMVGPNCMGIYSRKGRIPQTPDQPFGPGVGEIAAISQSGGNGVNLIRLCQNSGIIANCGVSIGNQTDLCLEDFLEWFAADDDIKGIIGYIEDFKNGRRFLDLAKTLSLRKPIILWKGGRTPKGAQAAASHTGALALPGDLWDGLCRQSGIIPADNLYDTINLARALLWDFPPKGPGVALLASGGGNSVSLADCSIEAGLEVPVLADATQKKLGAFIAKVNTIIDNPIDLGAASYQPQVINKAISVMAQDQGVDAFIVYHHVYPYLGGGIRERCKEHLTALSRVRQKIDKPIYVALYCPFKDFPEADESRRESIEILNDLKIPYAGRMESCIRMVKRTWDYRRYLDSREIDIEIVKKSA